MRRRAWTGVHVYQGGRLRLLTVAVSRAAAVQLATRLLAASPAEVRRAIRGELVVAGPTVRRAAAVDRAGEDG